MIPLPEKGTWQEFRVGAPGTLPIGLVKRREREECPGHITDSVLPARAGQLMAKTDAH